MARIDRSALALVLLVVALIIAFHRIVLGEALFWGIPALQFYPWREYGWELIRSGQLPLWNPYNGAGAPLLANYQSAFFYPLSWLSFVLPMAWAMSLTAILHLFLAGWGMWLFTGRLGLPSLGRGVSALAFGLTGYLVARLGTYPTISVAAWLPWLLWAAQGVMTQGRWRDAGWLALFTGMLLLAGHAQTAWYSLLLVGIFCAWWIVSNRLWSIRPVLLLGAGLALGVSIAAAQLIPTAELLRQSQRSGGVDAEFALNFSYGWARAFNWIMPNFFGNPGDGTFITQGAFFEDAVYIGLIPLISALVAILTWAWGKLRRSERPAYFRYVPFWLMIVVIAFVLALGQNTPIFPFLYNNVPTFNLFQAPVRWHIWTVFGLSVLAGIGVGMWGHGHWLFFGTRLATAAGIGAAILAILAPQFLPPEIAGEEGVLVIIRAVIPLGILGALAGVLTLTQPETQSNRWYPVWFVAALLVVAGDLTYAAWNSNVTVPASFYDRRPVESRAVRSYWSEDASRCLMFGDDEEGETLAGCGLNPFLNFKDYTTLVQRQTEFRTSHLPNLNLLDRTYSLSNFDPLLVGGYKQYTELVDAHPAEQSDLLRIAGVGQVYDLNGELRVLDAAPLRVWLASRAECGDQSTLQRLAPELPGLKLDCPANLDNQAAFGEVLSVTDAPSSTEIEVALQSGLPDGGVWLVLADTDYPGWVATIDGQPADIQRANGMFRAVWVPETSRLIRFEYRPWWVWPGLLVTLASTIAMLILLRPRAKGT